MKTKSKSLLTVGDEIIEIKDIRTYIVSCNKKDFLGLFWEGYFLESSFKSLITLNDFKKFIQETLNENDLNNILIENRRTYTPRGFFQRKNKI